MNGPYEVAIIGAGPAGIAAAIYLKRIGVRPLLFERSRVGGLLRNANLVENYPGFPSGIPGGELANLFEAQLRRWRIPVKKTEVRRVSRRGGIYLLHTAGGTFASRFLIVATGTRPRSIRLNGLDALPRDRVYYEAVDVKGSVDGGRFLIIGGGDVAFDYALNLTSRGCLTDIVFKSRKPKCIPLLLARAKNEKTIRLFPRTTPDSVRLVGGKISLKCRGDGGRFELQADAMMIACGREPDLSIFPDPARWRGQSPGRVTNRHGLFIIGDVKRGLYRQVGIAVGDGISAAMMIAGRLKEDSHEDIG